MKRHPIADKIEARMIAVGTTQKRLAKDAGIGETYVRDILKGKSKDPQSGKLTKIAEALGCTLDELIKGDFPTVQPVQTTQIVVRGAVQAGSWIEAIEWPEADWYAITAPLDMAYPGMPRYGLLVKGESMNRVFPDGSIVVVINFDDLGGVPHNGDYVVAIQRSQTSGDFEATVKAVQVREDGTMILWPQSFDPYFQSPVVLPDHGKHHCAGEPDVQIQSLVVASYLPNPKATF